jgi:hypothetical protein
MGTEQRKDIRFLVEDNIILALRNGFTKIGKVKDISIGGLSFEHIYDGDSIQGSLKGYIFLWINEFNMSKVPCKVVYDIPVRIPDEYYAFTIHFITRRCGLQFEALLEDQKTQLDFLLKTYTKATAP